MTSVRGHLAILVLVGALTASACATDDALPEVAAGADDDGASRSGGLECQWPMWGHDVDRSFAYPCPSGISPETVDDLRRIWFFPTDDVVSASPVVVDGRLYVGDWTGQFYALDAATGDELWRRQLSTNPLQYGGQISSSAAFATVDGTDALVVGSGMTVHAVAADDGADLWSHPLGETGTSTEILSSPLVVGNTVVVTYDAHGAAEPTGIKALSLETGEEVWYFDPENGDHRGCGGIWGSPTIDVERGLVFAGTANCPPDRGDWTQTTEALLAVDLASGELVWSYQPHPQNDRDTDFAGAPNLFSGADGRALVGLGNKDAHYYAVDRDTGELVWEQEATEEGYVRPGFATGGFVGPSAYADGVIVGATAVAPCPCMHAFDAATGEILWQNLAPGPSYAPTTVVGGVAFTASSTDNQLRGLDLGTGEVLWRDDLGVLLSGGVAVVGDDLWAAAGFREPGSAPSESSGVHRFTVDPAVEPLVAPPPDDTEADPAASAGGPVRLTGPPRCVDEPCPLTFDLKDPPPGLDPTGSLTIETDPFRVTVETTGLGDPAAWLREGSDAANAGATAFALLISERDDRPSGGFLCLLDDGACTATTVPDPGASYNRITVMAVLDTETLPEASEGLDRLVDTIGFDPPLQTEALGTDPGPLSGSVVLSGQGNDLVAYDLDGNRRLVIPNAGDDPDAGRDINAQVCFLDEETFIAGEDTGQPVSTPGWGLFRLAGEGFADLSATQIGKLLPTYQPADSQPEMFGCGVLGDGRVVLTDVGNQAAGPGTGQLLLFFPPEGGYEGEITEHCKLDVSIATAQQIAIDGDDVLVASARPPTVGVLRYTDLPTSAEECREISPERFIDPADGNLGIANGITAAPAGGWYVSSVFTGVINEYDTAGGFVREILRPPSGETLGTSPFSTGTPNGLATTADGTLWFADLGIVVDGDGGIGPGTDSGTVRRIRFVDGDPQAPEIVDDGLQFPDAVSVIP